MMRLGGVASKEEEHEENKTRNSDHRSGVFMYLLWVCVCIVMFLVNVILEFMVFNVQQRHH